MRGAAMSYQICGTLEAHGSLSIMDGERTVAHCYDYETARLIVAGPAMLAALNECIDYLLPRMDADLHAGAMAFTPNDAMRLYSECRAAIAKATK